MSEKILLTPNDKKELADEYDGSGRAAGLVTADEPEQDLFMDSHGCMVILVPCRRESDDALYGFLYRRSSEEAFFDTRPMEAFPIVGKEVARIEYSLASGEDWSDLL